MAKKKKPAGTSVAVVEKTASGEKKPGDRGFKVEQIRLAAKANPELGPTKMAAMLTEKFKANKEVFSPSLISNVLGGDKAPKKAKTEKVSRVGNGKPKGKKGGFETLNTGSSKELAAVILFQKAGSLEAAKETLEMVAAVAQALGVKIPF